MLRSQFGAKLGIFDLFGVRYLLSIEELPTLGQPVVPPFEGPGGKFYIYERKTALPRAFLVPRAERAVDDDTTVAAIIASAGGDRITDVTPVPWKASLSLRWMTRMVLGNTTTAAASPPRSSASPTPARNSDTASESSRVRAGASPSQKGIVGGAPPASSTRTTPDSTRWIRQEVLPSRKMSPRMLSIAQSSLTVPTKVSPGDATTR